MTTDSPRIGVLGGTFDPVHHGHLDAADAARKALALTEVMLMPSRVPPHKGAPARASGYHRFAMAALASAGRDGLRVSDLELRSSEPSYTSLTLQRLAQAGYAPSQLFFVVGSDAFADIVQWHDYPALLRRSHFAVVARPGQPLARLRRGMPSLADRMREPRGLTRAGEPTAIWLVEAETRNISSSRIRHRLAASESTGDLLPEMVAAYIVRHGLYGTTTPGELLA
ncbi:MAG: nicotinate-nucleotide adenylyltransferase [Acidobacteria bacterium]|nr:nicotinate-nucleotide adenylyltransferase [Acidobacteriota bacterium]